MKGRSFCPHCKHILTWQDLVPFVSFFVLGGKCRYCQQKISWQYPAVEVSTALLFLLIFNQQFISTLSQFTTTLYLFLVSSFLIVIFVYDLKHYIIPDKIVYPAIVIAFLYQLSVIIWNLPAPYHSEGIGAGFRIWSLGFGILPSLFFLGIILLSQGRLMGMGDFKLAILMGLILGWPNISVALFLAFLIGAIMGAGLILSGRKSLKSEVPFGPFLVGGTFLAFFWGDKIINWYFNFLL
ncbi:MAG: leader peptidase (prepilin peptidase) / N-methyltransferase [Parcubacteria group bacterium Gr01-1014_30]|nr:MAG: leader peptidase (prepilin peptidase) / N-methyltransferase [Parcubacteria group bacterium Gr01-1014_30]